MQFWMIKVQIDKKKTYQYVLQNSSFSKESNMADIKKLYEKNFDEREYATTYLSAREYDSKWFVEEFYHYLFNDEKLRGKTLIDVGCGPSFRAALLASRYECEAYCADLLKQNREFVQNWLEHGSEAFDFSDEFKYVAQLEGKKEIGYLEERVKKCVKGVISCDILLENPLHPQSFQQFDVVTSSYCLDCYPDEADRKKGVRAMARLVRPGGFVAVVGTVECKDYTVGDSTFPSAYWDGGKAKDAFTEAGFKVLQVCEHFLDIPIPLEMSAGIQGLFSLYAIKL